MKTATKIWLIAAAALVVIGAAVCAYAVSADGLPAAEYETDTVEVTESFRGVSVRCDTEDIALLPSEDGKCRAVFAVPEQTAHSVTVQDGTLTVGTTDTGKWYEHFTLFPFGSPKLMLYLPQGEYDSLSVTASTADVAIPQDFTFENAEISVSTGDVDFSAAVPGRLCIGTSTGDIRIGHVTAGTLELSVSTGGTTLTDVRCKELSSRGSTGDLIMQDVTAAGTIKVERSTGDVRLERCDAAALEIATDTGDVTGSLLSEKVFFAQSDTGDVHVPETATGGTCKITTDTGDILITVQ